MRAIDVGVGGIEVASVIETKKRRQKAYCNFSGLLHGANVKRALVFAAFQLK